MLSIHLLLEMGHSVFELVEPLHRCGRALDTSLWRCVACASVWCAQKRCVLLCIGKNAPSRSLVLKDLQPSGEGLCEGVSEHVHSKE